MSDKIHALVIGQSEIIRYEEYSKFPLNRIHHFKDQVHLRMLHLNGAFRSHLDILNYAITGKFYNEAAYAERRKMLNIWNLPGLSSLLVANAGCHSGFNVKVINNFDSEFDLFKEYYESQDEPPLVGISTTFYLGYAEVKRLVSQLRGYDPEMKIVLGGAFSNEQTINNPMGCFEEPMRKYGIDYHLHAFNSDIDFPKLLDSYFSSSKDFSTVPNLAYFDQNGSYSLTEKKWHDPSVNKLPMRWKDLDLSFVNRTIQLRAASGCPFACSFCTYPDTAGGHYAMELELVDRQLSEIQSLGFIENIIFIDDTFNVPTGRFKKILQLLCKYNFSWFSFLRIQYVDEEVARLMRDSGCKGVYLGIESSNDQLLKNMNKKVTRAEYLRGMEHLNHYGIPTFAAFVVGFPGETEETIQGNIDFLKQCHIDFYSTKEFFYMPHAQIHKDREKYGLEGMGNRWKHGTMSSATASEMKIRMFKEVKNSTFVDPDLSLWYLAYLYDQGYEVNQIKSFQKIINEMMLQEISGNFGEKETLIQELSGLFRKPKSVSHPLTLNRTE